MLGIDILYEGAHPLQRSVFNRLKRDTFEVLGTHWHRHLRPKHFTHAGAREYGYLPRKGDRGNAHRHGFRASYTGRKLRRFGHTRPLEFSGEGRRLSRVRDIRVTSKRLRVVLPAKFNFRNPHSRINMREELTRVSEAEERELGRIAQDDLTRRINEVRGQHRQRIA